MQPLRAIAQRGHRLERAALVPGIGRHRTRQGGHQIVAAHQLHVDVGPGGPHLVASPDQSVEDHHGPTQEQGGDAETYDEIRYEGYGPNGIALVVEAMTDNRNRTASNVRSYFTKAGGDLGQTGSVSFMFDRVGEIMYPATAGDADTVMLAALEAGAEDVESDDEGHWIYCADTDLNEVSIALDTHAVDAPPKIQVSTGIGFLDHMLHALAKHGGLALELQ